MRRSDLGVENLHGDEVGDEGLTDRIVLDLHLRQVRARKANDEKK